MQARLLRRNRGFPASQATFPAHGPSRPARPARRPLREGAGLLDGASPTLRPPLCVTAAPAPATPAAYHPGWGRGEAALLAGTGQRQTLLPSPPQEAVTWPLDVGSQAWPESRGSAGGQLAGQSAFTSPSHRVTVTSVPRKTDKGPVCSTGLTDTAARSSEKIGTSASAPRLRGACLSSEAPRFSCLFSGDKRLRENL